jgi:hypothetical protein
MNAARPSPGPEEIFGRVVTVAEDQAVAIANEPEYDLLVGATAATATERSIPRGGSIEHDPDQQPLPLHA